MLTDVDRRISVLVAVAPRLLGDTLAAALRDAPDFEVVGPVGPDEVTSDRVDATVVTGRCPSGMHADVVLELPAGSEWTGSGWLEIGGQRREVPVRSVDAVCGLLRHRTGSEATPDSSEDSSRPHGPPASDFETTLAAAKAGDGAAVTRLYRDHNPPLLRYLRSRAPREAEDLASETWMGVARGLARFDGSERAFRGWLFAIAHNRVAGHYRRPGRDRSEAWPVEALAERDSGVDVAQEALRGMPADAAIAELVAGLNHEMSEVIRLRVIAGLSTAE